MRLIFFFFQEQITFQTMNLLLIYDCLDPPCLFMVSLQEKKQGGDLGDEQGGYPGSKVKSMHLKSPAFLLHLTLVVLHTMVHSYYISYQHIEILLLLLSC